jgi:glycosyltransferase involved in cell wall biosynthesis
MPSISYAITACNEHVELDRLLSQLTEHIRPEDEIIVQVDTTATEEVKNVIWEKGLTVYSYPLNNDFATFKNNLKSKCTKDYIFQIDADETVDPFLLSNLHDILEMNTEVEVYLVPRVNIVNGLTDAHIQKWGWMVNDHGYVNWPDYQWRIYKNAKHIKWENRVHERLVGFNSLANLPSKPEYALNHIKLIERQERQNALYDTI